MTTRRHQPAKLTRPRLHKAVARERLFRLVDAKREHACVWVVGPPGAGKTTLIASYLSATEKRALWYQMDNGDSDPATFFYYLREAVAGGLPAKARLPPLLTPEYLGDLPGFARRFFRAVFNLYGGEFLLVFDNYHEVAPDSVLHSALASGLEEVRDQSNLLVISRADPHAAFARAVVNGAIARIDWEELRLTRGETGLIARSLGVATDEQLDALHSQCSGWMAGLVLMSKSAQRGGETPDIGREEVIETVFDYFAGQIFETISPATREALIRTALLPRVSAATARLLAGTEDAIVHVEGMYRRRLFTDRTPGVEPNYQYHALFRSFLLARAQSMLSVAERNALLCKAALAMEHQGDIEDGFRLAVSAGEWAQAERMFVVHAGALIAQGRWRTLREWSAQLPSGQRENNPWIGYWLGRSISTVEPPVARAILDAAHAAFVRDGDELGQLLCSIGILEALYYEYTELRMMDGWIGIAARHLESGVVADNPEDELWVNAVFMNAAIFRAPGHPLLKRSVGRVKELLPQAGDVNLKVTIATMLHYYANCAFDTQATALAIQEARPLLPSGQLTSQRAALYLGEEGYGHYVYSRYAQALACFEEAVTLARVNGLIDLQVRIGGWRGFCQRRAGFLESAEATLKELEEIIRESSGVRFYLLHFFKGELRCDRGDPRGALPISTAAQARHDAIGSKQTHVLMGLINAQIAIAAGEFSTAENLLAVTEREIAHTVLDPHRATIALNRAWLSKRLGDRERAAHWTRAVLDLARGEREYFCLRWYPTVLAEVLPIALDLGIEMETANRLIADCALIPADPTVENWPWPVKVKTLGRFELLVDGRVPAFGRKSPRKVLSLLKTIIALGSIDVPEQQLSDLFWPDRDGDAGHNALAALLHRLRVLLGRDGAIRQKDGKLSLDRMLCWVDAHAFEQWAASAQGSESVKAIQVYRGAFLGTEDEAWLVPYREKLRAQFVDLVARHAAGLEGNDQLAEAAACYARGIETDDLIEPFYQGLMRCYERLDRRAEAASVYQRLRQILSIRLGTRPSPASDRLFQSVRSA